MSQTDVSKTGEDTYRSNRMSFDQVSFNGTKGMFVEMPADAKRDDKTGKYPKSAITKTGESFDVVFLKIRRMLSSYAKKDGKYAGMRSSEHNHKNEKVVLYTPAGKEYGIAADLRVKYEKLKTTQVVYAYVPAKEKVVRLLIKGSSLISNFEHPKGSGVKKFYEYLQSIPEGKSSTEFITTLTPVEEEGPQGTYYALNFIQGAELDEETMAKTRKMIDDIHDAITKQDERQRQGFGKDTVETEEVPDDNDTDEEAEGSDGVEYPTEDINPDDIPF